MPLSAIDWDRVIEVAAIVAAAGAAIGAWWTARRAASIAADARDAEKDQAGAAREALRASRRQVALSAIPHLKIDDPTPVRNGDLVRLVVRNPGPIVAYGVLLTVRGAHDRGPDNALDARVAWGRWAALAPDEHFERRFRLDKFHVGDPPTLLPWLLVTVEYYGPYNALVRMTYEAGTDERDKRWRLRRVVVDPRDGDAALTFDPDLGPDSDVDEPPGLFIAFV